MVRRGLGKGLNSLIPSGGQVEGGLRLEQISIKEIATNPYQPRKSIEQESFQGLVTSVKEHGVVQPIVVRPKGLSYELIAGERRWRAAQEAGLEVIPAIVKEASDAESLELALVENLQRENLNAMEEAMAYRELIDKFNLTQAELAAVVGKSRTVITNTLRLFQLPKEVRQLIEEGNLSSGHARTLLSLEDEKKQIDLANRIIQDGLSVRQTENMVRLLKFSGSHAQHPRQLQPKAFKTIAKKLSERLSTKVKVKMTHKKGKIEISFKSLDDLERICQALNDKASSE
ncbi:ParB/RepB/Spo0J family partition protein [Candidatus Oleimmundimicrobium sp.]|uniref:ParB/RepB/Spo0J family partition protein n=1 Tax=Candidatus Oleimmundimicrobium sp. TaxID=3060597 RepID=UPI00271621BA|nr:ParB/RepB/Spo0J family partition protein [Candidatus Oleimmundimicrobium sp.]MDO8886929.1 ParB/RepB/Spo0J family partition protein [Candidatus Oleimmundimicrobium sp.]